MSEKKSHYYVSCVDYIENGMDHAYVQSSLSDPSDRVSILLAHIADRLGDLVLAIEELTQSQMYPPPK